MATDTGALTIASAGSCEVTLSASLEHYREQTLLQTVTVEKAAQSPAATANPYAGVVSLANGESLEVVNAPSGGVGTFTYNVKSDSASCTVDPASGTVTAGADSGNCTIEVVWSGDDNHNGATVDFASIPMAASNSPDPVWASPPYGGTLTVGGTPLNPSAFTNASSGVGAPEYRSGTIAVCTVDATSGALSGASVGECRVEARFVGNATTGASGWSRSEAIAVGKGAPAPANINGWGATASVKVGAVLEIVNPFTGYGTAAFAVKSGSESYCEVDEVTGAVTGLAVGSCIVQGTFAEGDDYTALGTATDLGTITVASGDQSLTYGNIYGEEPGTGSGTLLPVVETPVSAEGGSIAYRVKPTSAAHCEVAVDGSVTLEAPGECVVQIRAEAVTNYADSDWIDGATLEVVTGTFLEAAWDPPGFGRMGEELELPALETGIFDGTVLYTVTDAGDSGCSFKGRDGADARTLIFTAPGDCRVESRAVREYFANWHQEVLVRVRAGAITVTVNGFTSGDVLKVGADPVLPVAYADLTPSDAAASWRLMRGEEDCELVSATTGAVRASAIAIDPTDPPRCSVQLTASKDNYDVYRSDPISISLQRGDLGTLTRPVYSTGETLRVEGSADLTAIPVEGNDVPVVITEISVAGADSDGVGKEGVCSVDDDADSATFGRVTSEGSTSGDSCTVNVTVKAVGYASKAAPELVLILGGDLIFATAPVVTWNDGNDPAGDCALSAGGSEECAVDATGLPATDDGGATVTWSYQSDGVDDNGDGKDNVCAVAADGALTVGSDAIGGDVCRIWAVGWGEMGSVSWAQDRSGGSDHWQRNPGLHQCDQAVLYGGFADRGESIPIGRGFCGRQFRGGGVGKLASGRGILYHRCWYRNHHRRCFGHGRGHLHGLRHPDGKRIRRRSGGHYQCLYLGGIGNLRDPHRSGLWGGIDGGGCERPRRDGAHYHPRHRGSGCSVELCRHRQAGGNGNGRYLLCG